MFLTRLGLRSQAAVVCSHCCFCCCGSGCQLRIVSVVRTMAGPGAMNREQSATQYLPGRESMQACLKICTQSSSNISFITIIICFLVYTERLKMFFHLCACVFLCVCHLCHRGQERAADLLVLEL